MLTEEGQHNHWHSNEDDDCYLHLDGKMITENGSVESTTLRRKNRRFDVSNSTPSQGEGSKRNDSTKDLPPSITTSNREWRRLDMKNNSNATLRARNSSTSNKKKPEQPTNSGHATARQRSRSLPLDCMGGSPKIADDAVRRLSKNVSLSECLTALSRGSIKAVNEEHGDDSVGDDMPSLVSFGQPSVYSRQSFASDISGGGTLTSCSTASLLSSTSKSSFLTPSTESSNPNRKLRGTRSVEQREFALPGKEDSLETATKPPATPRMMDQKKKDGRSPIQIVRVKKPEKAKSNTSNVRGILRPTTDYQPDILPRRESRWKSEIRQDEQPIRFSRPRKSRVIKNGALSPPERSPAKDVSL